MKNTTKENINNNINSNKNDTHCRGTVHRARIENSTDIKFISILKNVQGAGLDSARDQRGITLIALIITVIVLLILAGVALNFIVGQNGILTHSETSKQKYELASAREELEMVITDTQTEILKTEGRKATLVDLENRIDKNKYSIILSTDPIATTTAVSANYTYATVVELEKEIEFTIDDKLIIREVELVSVKQGTAEVEISTAIKEYVGKDENNKYRVKYEITLSTMQGVKSIIVESGEEKQELTIDENLTKEVSVEIGKVYTITVTMEDGKYKRKTIYDRATETIKTAEELAQFRDKVNSGLSYEGKTIELANDINLSSVCGASVNGKTINWIPIGTTTTLFKGIFDGKNYAISHIYINTTQNVQGLFGDINGGKVRNVIVEGQITSGKYAGGICARSNNGVIENCVNKAVITVSGGNNKYDGIVGGIVGDARANAKILNCINKANITGVSVVGGIVGYAYQVEVENCYNIGNIIATGAYINGEADVGGIIGSILGKTIKNCYNIGNVQTNTTYTVVGGIVGYYSYASSTTMNMCINTGVVKRNGVIASQLYNGSGYTGTIIGRKYSGTVNSINSITSEQFKAYTEDQLKVQLGSAYTNDIKIKVKDEITGEEKEVWKYNDGYPILKWQLENN